MIPRIKFVSSYSCEITVDEKDSVYLKDILKLITDSLDGAIAAILNDSFGELIAVIENSELASAIIGRRVSRYVRILTERYSIPQYIADQIGLSFINLAINLLNSLTDMAVEDIDSMSISHEIVESCSSVFKVTGRLDAVYRITGYILQLPRHVNSGYPFNSISRVIA